MNLPTLIGAAVTVLCIINLLLLFRLHSQLRDQNRASIALLLKLNHRLAKRSPFRSVERASPPALQPLDPTAGFRDPCR